MIPPIRLRVLFEVKNLDPGDVYKRDHSIVDTHISLFSNSNMCIKPIPMSSIFLTMCISSEQSVRPRQEGPQCDGCLRWQHCTCDTGVSQSKYRDAVKTGASIDWRCLTCDIPQAESTALSEISVSADPDVHFNSEQNSNQGMFHLLLLT